MKTYYMADPHAGHVNMTKAGKDLCGRPFADVVEMNAALLEGINSTVTEAERLVILGDILMGKLEESLLWLAEIRAREIILIPGNHDRWSLAYHHKGSEEDQRVSREQAMFRYEVHNRIVTFRDEQPSVWWGKELYETSGPLAETLFSHYPYDGDSHGEDRYAHLRAEDRGLPIIHGHVHTEWRIKGRQFNVGVDVNDFKPVSDVELADWVKSL